MDSIIKLQLPCKGKYGATHTSVTRPTIDPVLAYLNSDNSVSSKNKFINGLCDIAINDYPVGTREYIFVSLRSLINSSNISGTLDCKKGCGSVAYMLNLSQCAVHTLPADFMVDYEYTFPISKHVKTLNVLTCKKEELVEDYISFYKAADIKLTNSGLGDNLEEMARYAALFSDSVDINTLDENILFLRKELPWDDFIQLMVYESAFQVGPEVLAVSECDICKSKYRVHLRTDSSFFGVKLESLVHRHRFLARTSGIGFEDFKQYTFPIMDVVTEGEVTRIKDTNAKIRAAKSKKR